MDRNQCDGSEAQKRVLNEHEDKDCEKGSALEQGQGEGVAEEATQRFHLGSDHGHQLALGCFLELRQRKAQRPRQQGVAQPA